MSMPGDMKMEAGMNMNMGSSAEAGVAIAPEPASMNHTMFKLDFARNPAEQTVKMRSGTRAPSGSMTSCAEEACSHISISGAPPNARGLLARIPLWIGVASLIHPDLLTGHALTAESDISPLKLSPPDDLVSLRI